MLNSIVSVSYIHKLVITCNESESQKLRKDRTISPYSIIISSKKICLLQKSVHDG